MQSYLICISYFKFRFNLNVWSKTGHERNHPSEQINDCCHTLVLAKGNLNSSFGWVNVKFRKFIYQPSLINIWQDEATSTTFFFISLGGDETICKYCPQSAAVLLTYLCYALRMFCHTVNVPSFCDKMKRLKIYINRHIWGSTALKNHLHKKKQYYSIIECCFS